MTLKCTVTSSELFKPSNKRRRQVLYKGKWKVDGGIFQDGSDKFIPKCMESQSHNYGSKSWRKWEGNEKMEMSRHETKGWGSSHSVQFSLVTQSCPTLCNPMNRSTPGLPVHHQLPEFTQTHVHRVGDAIQPSHPLSSPSPPAPNSSQHHGLFQWVNSSHEVAKVLEFQI